MSAIAHLAANSRVVDLTHTLSQDFPLLRVHDPVRASAKFSVAKHGFCVRSWSFDEHCARRCTHPRAGCTQPRVLAGGHALAVERWVSSIVTACARGTVEFGP